MADQHLPTLKQTADIEKPKQLARNVFNDTNEYSLKTATTLDDKNKIVSYNTGIKKSMEEERTEMLARNRYNASNEYKPTD